MPRPSPVLMKALVLAAIRPPPPVEHVGRALEDRFAGL
jgi:hypothetical protein